VATSLLFLKMVGPPLEQFQPLQYVESYGPVLLVTLSITDFTFSENVTSACEIHGLPKCVLCKCRPILLFSDAADSLTVGFVKHVLCGHFHVVPLIILIW